MAPVFASQYWRYFATASSRRSASTTFVKSSSEVKGLSFEEATSFKKRRKSETLARREAADVSCSFPLWRQWSRAECSPLSSWPNSSEPYQVGALRKRTAGWVLGHWVDTVEEGPPRFAGSYRPWPWTCDGRERESRESPSRGRWAQWSE